MSHSAPSESSAIEPAFIVGTDLVEFDRHDLPIYQTPEARWGEACLDDATYGAPLDRLFGEPGDVHVDGMARAEFHADLAIGDDPLVALASLSDGLMLPATDLSAVASHGDGVATTFDIVSDTHAVAHLHDGWHGGWHGGWGWDASGTDWTFDFRS